MENMTSPSVINEYIRRSDFFFKKNLGQNFLRDENVARSIVDELGGDREDAVLEIGPGFGALTQFLIQRYDDVTALEIDPFAIGVLTDVFSEAGGLKIVKGDVLKQDLAGLLSDGLREGKKLRAISNLPYYITSQVIIKLLSSEVHFENIVVMVQKEVSARLSALPGTKDYSAFTVLLNYYADVYRCFDVSHTCFIPEPRVDSTVMRIVPLRQRRVAVSDEDRFVRTVKAAFSMRRKTLLNCISMNFSISKDEAKERIRSAGFDPGIRGEILDLGEFAALSEAMPL